MKYNTQLLATFLWLHDNTVQNVLNLAVNVKIKWGISEITYEEKRRRKDKAKINFKKLENIDWHYFAWNIEVFTLSCD